MIKNGAHERQGKAIHNFKTRLPSPQSDIVHQALKDTYIFDFLTLGDEGMMNRARHEPESPLASDGIFGNARIGCEDDHALRNRLADEYPVEGVLVIIREAGKLQYCGFAQGQRVDLVAGAPFLDEFVRRIGQR